MKTDFHHVYSKGEKVIFRDEEDYIHFQNRLAIDKYGKNIKILAYSIMSTHVHLIVITWDEEELREFLSTVKRSYAVHFKRKYEMSLPKGLFNIEYSDEDDLFENKRTRLIYVLRNPMHHQVCGTPLSYEFSSARFTYWNELFGESIGRLYLAGLRKISDLNYRDTRRIISSNRIDENTLVDLETKAISPISIIDLPKVRAYWGKYIRGYILDLHVKAKDSSGEYINEDSLCVQTDKLSDIEVCKIIDDFALESGARSFAFLKGEELSRIIDILYKKSASKAQIERCLWVDL